MKVIFQKADLDTCLAALILGVAEDDEIIYRRGGAAPEELADPKLLCIEAGGSGQTDLNNFDHHDVAVALPPACEQALSVSGNRQPGLQRLVEYVAILDTEGPKALRQIQEPTPGFPRVSHVFGGMLTSTKEPKEQFEKGIEILRTVLSEGFDPFGIMPERPDWKDWIEARRKEKEALTQAKSDAKFFATNQGKKAGFIETDLIGAIGLLYGLGCEIAVAYSPRYGHPPVPKYTISGRTTLVNQLVPLLNALDPGWGGHLKVIGSPRTGSALLPDSVMALIKEHL